MADDMVVLQCEKCGARLKVRAAAVKFVKDVKCVKCGNKVSTRAAAPATAAPEAPVAPTPPAAVEPVPAAPPPPVTPEAAPALAAPPPPSVPTAPSPPAVPPELEQELARAKARVVELERLVAAREGDLAESRRRVAELEARPVPVASPTPDTSAELAEARRLIAEQEQRVGELQSLWYQKEKESRTAQSAVTQARQERDAVLGGIRALLKHYHEAEIQAATDRITQLDARIRQFLGGPDAGA
jgi:predicted RNA-binding Zn-ribbon protein involved in translation (DUF1610 family)